MPSKKKSTSETPRAPEPIGPEHDLTNFNSGEPTLDDWLRRRAIRNEVGGASRTYVVCNGKSNRVIAYYCLATGAIAHSAVGGRIRRNMPDPIPAMVLGRMAVDLNFHRSGLGKALLRDAALRTLQAAQLAGIRVLLVHAISESAKKFYAEFGFLSSPVDPMTLMISIAELEHALGET
ncbi:GNAT family N-acetyltransferase [Pseudorhodoplanes sp.]|uniref:GNAT family N-acetyltransferase n=1 Tax=Pseudorhodoplanes sp. TaxID=1934341 RepID=UPI003D12EDFF